MSLSSIFVMHRRILKELAYKQETVKNFYISNINKILLMAAKALNCYGSVIQYEKMVTVSHLSGNETSNIIDLALYNEYSKEPEITQEQLDSEFVALISGEWTWWGRTSNKKIWRVYYAIFK